MKECIEQINCVKIGCELNNLQVTTAFVGWSFRKLVKEIEDIVERDIKIKHCSIASARQGSLEDKIQQFIDKTGYKVNPEDGTLEYSLPVLVQSGKKFNFNKLN